MAMSDDEVAWGPKSPEPPQDEVAWGPKAPPPLGGEDVAWGSKSAPPPGEVKSFAALQYAMGATVDVTAGAGAPAQSADARKPYWGPKAAGMEFAGATLMGGWQFEHALVGQGPDGIRMSFSVVLGDRQRALGWLADTDGQAWSADALAISLVCFAAVGDF